MPPPASTPVPTPTPSPNPTPTAPPPLVYAGAHYDGHRYQRWTVQLAVSKDGKRVAWFGIGFQHGHCSNGLSFGSDDIGGTVKHGGAIGSKGQVTGDFASDTTVTSRHGKAVKGRQESVFRVRFFGDRLNGTLTDSFRSQSLTCSSGPVHFSAYRDGTASAPLRNEHIDTARYHGPLLTLRVFLPQAWISSLTIHWTAYCPAGQLKNYSVFSFLFIHGTRFGKAGHGRLPGPHGLYYRYHFRLAGTFTSMSYDALNKGTLFDYSVHATWSMIESLYRGGRIVGTCSTDPATVYSATAPEVTVPPA